MKKSQLLNEIQWLILESDCIDVPNSALINEVKLAKLILDLVESSGMLPPTIIIQHDDEHFVGFEGIETIEYHDSIVNEWEPEDEV